MEGLSQLEIMQRGVNKLLTKFNEGGYRYDAVAVMYLHDFVSSNLERDHLLPAIRAWNRAGKKPRLVVATPTEFFQHMEPQYRTQFETFTGDWTGLWSEVKTNSPRISADARWAEAHTQGAEMIWTLLTFKPGVSYPWGNFEDSRIKLLKYAEHSGSGQVGWPKLMTRSETEQQNREYVQYASTARADIHRLLDSGMLSLFSQQPDPAAEDRVVVFNPLSWPRSGSVRISAAGTLNIRDIASGKLIPSQRISKDEIEFLAEEVPSLGYRTYTLEPAAAPNANRAPLTSTILENKFYRVEVRQTDGSIIRLLDRQANRELLDAKNPRGAGELLRWTLLETFPNAVGNTQISSERGPVADYLRIHRPGSYWADTTIELPTSQKLLRITTTLDRSRMPYVASLQPGEYYTISFPFKFTGSADVWLDDGVGFHRIPDDSLPGARTDSGVPQHSVVFANHDAKDPYHVVICEREPFFNYLVGMPGTKGSQGAFMNEVRVAALRKQDQGDTKDLGMVNFDTVEPGLESPLEFSIAVTSGDGTFDPVTVYHAGWEQSVPLLVSRPLPGTRPAQAAESFLSVDSSNIAILAFKPSSDGDPNHFTLRLQEVSGRPTDAVITTRMKPTVVEETTMTEEQVLNRLSADPVRVHLGPHQTMTLRLTIPHENKIRSHRWWEW
jgi:hypothetical protein